MDNLGKTLKERQQFKFILFQKLNFTKGTLKMLQFDLTLHTSRCDLKNTSSTMLHSLFTVK